LEITRPTFSNARSELQRGRQAPAPRLLQIHAFVAGEIGVEPADGHATLVERVFDVELDRGARLQPGHPRVVTAEEIEGLQRLTIEFLAEGRHARAQVQL